MELVVALTRSAALVALAGAALLVGPHDVAALALLATGATAATIAWLAERECDGELLAVGLALAAIGIRDGSNDVPVVAGALAAVAAVLAAAVLVRVLVPPSRLVAVLLGLAAAGAAAHAVLFDPLVDRRCFLECRASPLAFGASATTESVIRVLDAAVPVAIALGGVWLTRAVGGRRLAAAVALLAAASVRAVAIAGTATDDPTLALNRTARATAAAAVLAVAAVVIEPAVRTLRARRAMGDVRRRIEAAGRIEDVGRAIAAATGDPTAAVVYRTPHGWTDGDGHPAAAPPAAAILVQRGGEPVAAIITGGGVETLRGDLTPALELAIVNEQLRAAARARLEHLSESRARVVVAGDAARCALERDLHDGAQQRLVAVSFELRRARSRAAGVEAARLDEAIEESLAALAELRDLAHGIFPTMLVDAGLVPALGEIQRRATVPVTVDCTVEGRLPVAVEMAAYRVVADVVDHAARHGGASRVAVEIARSSTLDVFMTVSAVDESAFDDDLVDATDRVGALGGSVRAHARGPGRRIEVAVPCAS